MSTTLEQVKIRYSEAKTFTFGDSRELCDSLVRLVRQGKKKATCAALRDFVQNGEPIPVPGRKDIALDWNGNPALVIETTEVTIRKFCDVDTSFALAEGEDETLEDWQTGHKAYFERNGGWSPEMELVCERFQMIEDLADVESGQ